MIISSVNNKYRFQTNNIRGRNQQVVIIRLYLKIMKMYLIKQFHIVSMKIKVNKNNKQLLKIKQCKINKNSRAKSNKNNKIKSNK